MSFHVPEDFRIRGGALGSSPRDGCNGAFAIPGLVPNRPLRALCSDGAGWEHVSVSVAGQPTKTPTWGEMDYVCRLFWDGEDVVMQLHPRRSKHVSFHEGCLHLWRPIGVDLPEPHPMLVGPVAEESPNA